MTDNIALLPPPTHQELLTQPPDPRGRIPSRGAAMITARTLLRDHDTDTGLIEGYGQFDPDKHPEDAADYVRHKAERFAIQAAVIDWATDRIVTNPSDVREARFIGLPDTTDTSVVDRLEKLGRAGVTHSGSYVSILEQDVAAAFYQPAAELSSDFPGYDRIAARFRQISERPKGATFNLGINTLEASLIVGSSTLSGLVGREYIPLIQRLISENEGNPDLATTEDRLALARDLAQKIVFSTAVVNLGHLGIYGQSNTAWKGFDVAQNIEAEIAKKDGTWEMMLASSSRRPPKPKTGLAGDTINCPAILQLEAEDAASPLHRLVYATLNEAYERDLFTDEAIDTSMEYIADDRAIARANRQLELDKVDELLRDMNIAELKPVYHRDNPPPPPPAA